MANYTHPGMKVVDEEGFIRGHGTSLVGKDLTANISGFVTKTNKLISVTPVNSTYSGHVGDVIVGRVVDVADRGWKLDINGKFHATLLVNSLFVEGNLKKRKIMVDELQLRNIFREGDLVSAEVQKVNQKQSINLQTRSAKYGKLENGFSISVPHIIIRKMKSHFVTLECGINLILGKNGVIWIHLGQQKNAASDDSERRDWMEKIRDFVRVRNAIEILRRNDLEIYDKSIERVFKRSLELRIKLHEMLNHTNVKILGDPSSFPVEKPMDTAED